MMRFRLSVAVIVFAALSLFVLFLFFPPKTVTMVHWCYSTEPKPDEMICQTLPEEEVEAKRRKIFPELYK